MSSCAQELNDENINQSIRDRLLLLFTGLKSVGHCPTCALFVMQRELIKEFVQISGMTADDNISEIIKIVMTGTTNALDIEATIEAVTEPRSMN